MVDGSYIYWAGNFTNAIGRANLDRTGANSSFISTDPNQAGALAIDGGHLYWNLYTNYNFGRANLDGTGVTENFFAGLHASGGMTVR